MGKQKTAVEWLEEQFFFISRPDIFAQAKQMEKEQILDALQEFLDITLPDEVCDEYYESKYGKDENKAENND